MRNFTLIKKIKSGDKMEEDITRIYDEYEEAVMFCKFFVAEKLNHRPEMGRAGENILRKSLSERFSMLDFVSGFIVVKGKQSPQCDILVCRKNMHRRVLEENIFLVDPADCLMVIEVKSNITNEEFDSTIIKNDFFNSFNETRHIKLALFAYKARIGKKELYKKFGYRYDRYIKSYMKVGLDREQALDYFVCLHRKSVLDNDTAKQLFFIKDSEDGKKYECVNEIPVMKNFWNLINAFQR